MQSKQEPFFDLSGGLTTQQAVYRLYKDIRDYLNQAEPTLHDLQSWKYILRQAYSSKSALSTFRWTSILFLILSIVIYGIACKYGHFTTPVPLAIETIILIIVLFLNTALIYWNSRARHLEMFNKAKWLAEKIRQCSNNEQLISQWASGHWYPHTNTPTSPCITLQWTYRDGKLVNLPVSLLVSGDVILLNPGRAVPANCRRIDKVMIRQRKLHDFSFEENDYPHKLDHTFTYVFDEGEQAKDGFLNRGETFAPKVDHEPESFTVPRLRKAVKPCKFLVVETPYLKDLKVALNTHLNRRQPTAAEKELRLIFVRYLEHILVPAIFLLVLVFSVIHYCYVEFTRKSYEISANMTFNTNETISTDTSNQAATVVLICLRPIMAIIPLLPLALPLLWLILNVYGLIKLRMVHENFCNNEEKLKMMISKSVEYLNNESDQTAMYNLENGSLTNRIQREFFLDDIDPDRLDSSVPSSRCVIKRILKEVFGFFRNDHGYLWRTANLLHVLGSITALCCVDKKGILSWPSPTADKVFFLTSSSGVSRRKSTIEPHPEEPEDEQAVPVEKVENAEVPPEPKRHSVLSNSSGKAECVQLDITHDRHVPYGLQFDDIYWGRYLNNLKPLGLAILLNTCNKATQEEFVQFSDHIACEALNNEVAVPVVNKRCLCELARQIGFKDAAIKGYEYCYEVAMYRHIRPEVIQKGKLAKSLNFPRLKMPFPNMTCAIMKETFSGTSQLFSQGTGDLVLDACAEYWNGQSLVCLTDYERKKILDFYQRSSLTSYCCAFAYIPLINESGPPSHTSSCLSDTYIELPPDSSHLFPSQRSLDANIRGLGIDTHPTSHNLDSNFHNQNESMFLSPNSKLVGHHLSSDSLTKHELFDSGDRPDGLIKETRKLSEPLKTKPKLPCHESQKLEQTMKKVINEVFIGMTTLQYQACGDFVRLVELLEAACIRFVHFSKENELRSRVFSEKMGLESGWNCHISLLNDPEVSGENDSNPDTSEIKRSTEANSMHSSRHKSSRHSISSSSSESSLLDTKVPDSDSEDEQRTLSKYHRRRKQNSVSSDRSESMVSNSRFSFATRSKEFRSSSKNSAHSNPQRNLSPSPSRITTASTMTEHSAPIAFDMSNRAKLPKGIDNIRPHLEKVDNVPLLVSLFTDCTPEATKEMIGIMQEYEEVVCVIGSMANESNIPIFLQADASVGVEPMFPHVCITEPIRAADSLPLDPLPENFITPTELANELISLPCSLTICRQNAIIFYHLIMNSRDYMMRMRNIFQFFLSSCLSISLSQMITSLLFLPPLISPGIVLWLSLIVIPFLSLSLMGAEADPNVMNIATGKKLHLNKESIAYFFICYIIKFTPSILVCVIMFAIIINTSCETTQVGRLTLGPCWMFSDVQKDGDIKIDLIWASHLLIGQTIASFFLVLYLVIISMGFVHRNHLLWQRWPFTNLCWLITSIILIACHLVVCIIEIQIYVPENKITGDFIMDIIPFYTWIIGFTWPCVLVIINILTKRREIRMYSRQQRRARLEFGTKLGMNSPF